MAGSEGGKAAAAAGRGCRPTSRGIREHVIEVVKTAFVEGRLTKDELDARVGQTFAARTYAELATLTADIPGGLAGAGPSRKPARRMTGNAARWGASGLITLTILLAAAFTVASLRGDGGYAAGAFLAALVYFVFWLSAGADMLWEWHCASLPGAGTCVRCGHTAASHHAPASCAVSLGSLRLRRRCLCTGYVPPGTSPETADLQPLPSPY